MKEIRIIKALNQNFIHVSYVNTLDDIISIYKSRLIAKFPWMEELLIEVLLHYPIPSGAFNPNEDTKTLGILIVFNEKPTVSYFDFVVKNTFNLGLTQIYPQKN